MLATRMRYGILAARVLSYLQTTTSTSNASQYTFSGVGTGTAVADRRNIVAAKARAGGGALTSITVGGDSATELLDAVNGEVVIGLYIILNAVGTSEDIIVTFSASHTAAAIDTWESTGLPSNTPVDSGTSTAASPTDTLTTVSGGFVVAAVGNSHASTAVSWAGVTERDDQVVTENLGTSSGDATTTGSNLAITATITNSNDPVGVFASF